MDNIIQLAEALGFPALCILGMGWFLNKIQTENRKDLNKIQSENRADQKEQNERIMEHLKEVTQTNATLLDTNATLVRDINMKLDKLIEKGA